MSVTPKRYVWKDVNAIALTRIQPGKPAPERSTVNDYGRRLFNDTIDKEARNPLRSMIARMILNIVNSGNYWDGADKNLQNATPNIAIGKDVDQTRVTNG